MTKNTKSFVLPLTFIGIMFFAIGFALGINSLLVPVLQKSLGISNTASYLIIAATFIPFLVFGYPAGLTIKAIGYKRTMSLSFFIFAIAFYLFILSADQESFTLFLLASFISGAANAYLQASVNPYITILGPLDSAAKRISIMGICNKLAWPIPAIFIVWLLGKDVNLIGIEDLNKPFIIIICAFIALGIMAFFAPLPEVKAAGEDESENEAEACPYAATKTSVFLYLKDVGGSRTAIPRLSDTATAHFRALSPPFPAERHSHRIYCVALYIPGRCEITDMDRCTQNILSRCFCCPVHLLYSFEPAPEF